MPVPRGVSVVVPAKDEEQRLGATLEALAALPHLVRLVVVDDGSTDRTAEIATRSGAVVTRHGRNRGKAAAMATGAAEVARLEQAAGGREGGRSAGLPSALLFADADLEGSAAALGAICEPVLAGEADMTIALLPPAKGGGFGIVVRTARAGIEQLTGWTPTQPLSGMRCVTRSAFDAAQPLAPGWGVEVGLTVDVLRNGGRVVEVPCELRHRVTGRDWRSQLHRARQYRDVWLALAHRRRQRR